MNVIVSSAILAAIELPPETPYVKSELSISFDVRVIEVESY